jgi:hypothetical protein
MQRVKGKHRAMFDVPLVELGYPIIRSGIWVEQVQEVFKVPAGDIGVVIVVRAVAATSPRPWATSSVTGRHSRATLAAMAAGTLAALVRHRRTGTLPGGDEVVEITPRRRALLWARVAIGTVLAVAGVVSMRWAGLL